MGIKDETIKNIITRIQERYRILMGNKFVLGFFSELKMTRSDMADIEDLVSANRHYDSMGYDIEKLYDQIYSFVHILLRFRKEALPKMRNESSLRLARLSDDDKIRFKMTVENMDDNIQMLKSDLHKLYDNVKRVDLLENGQDSMVVFKRPHFKELDDLLLD
jgi:acetolactate synthase regulatory subunit